MFPLGRWRLGLRGQLVAQVVIGVVVVVGMLLLLRAYIAQEEMDRGGRARQSVGRVLAGYIDAQLTNQLAQLARAAGQFALPGARPAPSLLEDARSRLEASSHGVYLLDASGMLIAADPLEIGAVAEAVGRRPEVVEAIARGRPAVSGVHTGPRGRPQFAVVVPVRLAAGVGQLGSLVDPTSPLFVELVEAARAMDDGIVAEVVDQFGTVVSATQRERTLLPAAFPVLAPGAAGTGQIARPIGISGDEPFLVVRVPLERAPWHLVVAVPEARILAPVRRWDQPLAGMGIATFLVLVGLSVLTSRGIVGPVQTLIQSARRIARGDLASPVPRVGGGELGNLAAALDDMRGDLRTADQARAEVDHLKDEFISSVSHELRTPLGFVKGYATTLLRTDTRWDSRTARRCLEIIDESSDQLLELVDHLLDMSRINEGKLSVNPEPTALGPLIEEARHRYGSRSREHVMVARISPECPEVHADPSRVRQILNNLLDNAIKYSPEGGDIAIELEVVDTPVAPMAQVSVCDRGIGITSDQLEVVFDRFNRGRNPLIRKIRGVGLGLPICRGIVEAHGGRIWAERATEQGTIVRFTLPLARSAVEVGGGG
ncbi:MAG: HAMP domain-containing histidine kinase [Chloroflexota bacterium]|nr:MAG: HAMP domain-containing histidine kinase [Chloroflexota bacterium]